MLGIYMDGYPYRAVCKLCPWESRVMDGDSAAFDALEVHGRLAHPEFTFPGGELVPVPAPGRRVRTQTQ